MIDDQTRSRQPERDGIGNERTGEADPLPEGWEGEHADTESVNIIRNKTFNPELRRLVERVRDNEPGEAHLSQDPVTGQRPGAEELEMELYRLYYRARTLRDNLNVNISFNPFDLQSNLASMDMPEAMFAHMAEEMKALSYPSFAILRYDIERKGFVAARHVLERHDAGNIIISLRDGIFLEMLGAGEGIIVDENAIRNDSFLAKRFMPVDGSEARPLYFTALSTLGDLVGRELDTGETAFPLPFLPSSILMAELPPGEGRRDPADIHEALRRKIALHAFLLCDDDSRSRSHFTCDDVESTYTVLDYLFSVFFLRKDCVCISVVSRGRDRPGTGYLVKYIIAKTKRMLSSDSTIIHLLKNRLIFIVPASSRDGMRELVAEFNRLFQDRFSMREYRPADFPDSRDIIMNLVLGT